MIVSGMLFWTCSRYCSEKHLYVSHLIKFEAGRNEFRMLPEFVHVVSDRNGFVIVELKECISALVCVVLHFQRVYWMCPVWKMNVVFGVRCTM